MHPAEEQKLRHAAQLLKAGDKAQAQTLFSEALAENPALADAWVGLALCAEAVETRKKCLRRALALNPNYAYARKALERLEKETPPELPTPPLRPAPAPPTQSWTEKQVAWVLVGIFVLGVCLITGLVALLVRPPAVQVTAGTGRPRFIEFYADW